MLKSLGLDPSDFRSKSWEEFAGAGAPQIDFIFTVCDNAAGEVCPVWPGRPVTAHWGVEDPAGVTGTEAEVAAAFSEAARQLRLRIERFLALPPEALEGPDVRARLQAIGEEPSE